LKSLLRNGIDLADADLVVRFLNEVNWTNGTKDIVVNAYRDYLNSIGLTQIQLPEYRVEDKLPFIPLESEIDSIVSSVRLKMSSFLRIAKETASRPIEIWRLKWLDLDLSTRTVNISPAKYSNARKLKISEQTLNMLLFLRRKNQYIFSINGRFEEELEHFARNYQKARNRIADKLQNPRLRQISLRTFRHWKATMLYHQTKDIIYVKEFLGHKNIKNTLKYVHLSNALSTSEDQYICKVAKDIHEATELIELGYEYVTEMGSVKIFRKRK
jgi:integrase